MNDIYVGQLFSDSYLEHHGILGMKWGVRRFQNKDGTLTPKGKKRYSDDYREAKSLEKKGIKNLSNEELSRLNERRRLEKEYKDYTSKGESYTKKALVDAGSKLAVTAVKAAVIYAGVKYVKSKYDLTPEKIAKGMVDVSGKIAGTVAKETAKNSAKAVGVVGSEVKKAAVNTAKKATSAVGETVNKTVSSGVGAASQIIDNVAEEAKKKAQQSRRNIASTPGAKAYVNTINSLFGIDKKKKKRR